MHPDPHRLANEVRLRDRADKAAVTAVVTVVTHHEKMAVRNRIDPVSYHVSRICDQNLMLAIAELLNKLRVLGRRVRMLLEQDEVRDPIGGSVDDYERCARKVEEGLHARLQEVIL